MLITAILILLIWGAHIWQYFFLFDDFALVGDSAATPLSQIFGLPLFGFYRPIPFVLTKAQHWLSSWNPSAFALGNISLHAINSVLVFVLVGFYSDKTPARYVAALVFAASPWAGEAYFWTSGRFDVICVTFLL